MRIVEISSEPVELFKILKLRSNRLNITNIFRSHACGL